MLLYKTIARSASAEQTIEKSRFIAHIAPIRSKEEGDDFIAGVRTKHKDATHNVPAIVAGDKMQIQWASDDGEPAGTSGAPMLHMLVEEGLTNVAACVTRYFGGTKLGTGGLVRAYTSTLKLALTAAGIKEIRDMLRIEVRADYMHLARLQRVADDDRFMLEDVRYDDAVHLAYECESENVETLKNLVNEATAGSGKIEEAPLKST